MWSGHWPVTDLLVCPLEYSFIMTLHSKILPHTPWPWISSHPGGRTGSAFSPPPQSPRPGHLRPVGALSSLKSPQTAEKFIQHLFKEEAELELYVVYAGFLVEAFCLSSIGLSNSAPTLTCILCSCRKNKKQKKSLYDFYSNKLHSSLNTSSSISWNDSFQFSSWKEFW